MIIGTIFFFSVLHKYENYYNFRPVCKNNVFKQIHAFP